MALLLALARNVPQAHASLSAGAWDRSKFSGVEVYEKTLGILGFGRIGQLVAQRARGFGMRVLAFDAFVAEERFSELGVHRAASSDELYAESDFITIHLPKTAETENFLDAEAFSKMKDGVRVLNVARGPLLVEEDLKEAIDSGKVAGAALDVFREEPITEHPLFGYPNVIVTPHLGASTAEATDRAGYQAAEQVAAALTGGVVTSAVERAGGRARGPGGARAVPAAGQPARPDRRGPVRRPELAPGGVPGPGGRARHPPAHRPGAEGRAGRPRGGGRERRQRALAGRGARHRRHRDQPALRARLHRPGARDRGGRRPSSGWWAPCSAASTARTCWRPGARASTSSWRSTWRSSATATSRGCSAAWAPSWARRA